MGICWVPTTTIVLSFISTISIIIKMWHQNYHGPLLDAGVGVRRSDAAIWLGGGQLLRLQVYSLRFSTPTIKISNQDSPNSCFIENMLYEQRLTVHSQFLLACGEQLHPCYQDNLIEVEVRTKLKKISHRNILEETELWMIWKFAGFKISHDSLLAWWIRTANTNMATFDRTGFEKLSWQFFLLSSVNAY